MLDQTLSLTTNSLLLASPKDIQSQNDSQNNKKQKEIKSYKNQSRQFYGLFR